MARKKAGSRAAAGQAKARERARRKARVTGPSLAQAAYVPPSPADDAPDDEPEAVAAVAEATQAAPPSPAPATAPRTVAAPAPPARAAGAQRRERQPTGMTPTGSLKRELALIGSITLVIAAALAALATTTTLGA